MTKNNEIKEKVLEELKKLGLIKYIDEKIMSTTKYQVFLAEKVIDLTIKQFEQKEQEYKKLIWEATIVKDNDYKDKLDRIKTLEQQIESLKENKITKEWNYKGVNVGLTNSWFDDKEKFAVYYKEDLVPILDVLILSKKLQEENQQLKKEIESLIGQLSISNDSIKQTKYFANKVKELENKIKQNEKDEGIWVQKYESDIAHLKSQLQEQRNKIETDFDKLVNNETLIKSLQKKLQEQKDDNSKLRKEIQYVLIKKVELLDENTELKKGLKDTQELYLEQRNKIKRNIERLEYYGYDRIKMMRFVEELKSLLGDKNG